MFTYLKTKTVRATEMTALESKNPFSIIESTKRFRFLIFHSITIHTDDCSTGLIKSSKSSFRQAKESVLPFYYYIKYDRSGKTV